MVARLSVDRADCCSAFTARSPLSALIAAIFSLKGRDFRGLPAQAFTNFPFVSDDALLDENLLEPLHGFLALSDTEKVS
jgi:hypothetical protein